jgi:hypothetical protein
MSETEKTPSVPDWMHKEFERGYVPMDSPPGLEEIAYAKWKAAGGTVTGRQETETTEPAELSAQKNLCFVGLVGRPDSVICESPRYTLAKEIFIQALGPRLNMGDPMYQNTPAILADRAVRFADALLARLEQP